MDSLSQIVLGGALAAACVPARRHRAGLIAGAVLGTVPDLDVLPLSLLSLDPVQQMTLHRGASHSLLVLPWLGLLVWWLLRRWEPVREAPRRWALAIQLGLITHPILDAFTVYGTQLLWPLATPPTMWSSVFIIDPLYTLPLLIACVLAWLLREKPLASRALAAGIALSTAYLGWSLLAKHLVERQVEASLAGSPLESAPRFSVPMPFQTLLWRVVVMTPEGFLEGEYSLWADRGPIRFHAFASDVDALSQVSDLPAVLRLRWFDRGFMKAQLRDDLLVLSDLRMGAEPDYSFNFAVARRGEGGLTEIPPQQLAFPWQARRRLAQMWERIWRSPG